MKTGRVVFLLVLLGLAALAAGCAPSATPVPAPSPPAEPTKAPENQSTQAVPTPAAVQSPAPTLTPSGGQQATQPPAPELRVVELEWPRSLRLGESDVLRLSLVPSADGYTARAEFEEHPLATQEVSVPRPEGYILRAVARLDGPGFDISPAGDQSRLVPFGEPVTWRWSLSPRSPGRQRISVSLYLRWESDSGMVAGARESQAFGRALEIEVISFLGLTRTQTGLLGLLALLGAGVLGSVAILSRRAALPLALRDPNPALRLEPAPGMRVLPEETRLLQALFQRYARLVLEREFLSGYSGARTFLALPVRPDGSADAATIVKIGARAAIQDEYANYERFVRDRLPPVTARIQHAPVSVPGGGLAALQYTCISQPGQPPVSLRQALLADPDPAYLHRLFDTFGPHWWLQRSPYSFRAGVEYDRLLPPHLVLQPLESREPFPIADPEMPPGTRCRVPYYVRAEPRADGISFTLWLAPSAGRPPVRLRWLDPRLPTPGRPAVVSDTRGGLLFGLTRGFDLRGLPDPLLRLPGWLQSTLQGSRATIHGDLNLENALAGPGELVWLIDFAETREGHALYDLARLAAEIAAHIVAPTAGSPAAFMALVERGDPLLETVTELASRCLFDRYRPEEYTLALILACLGALKFTNPSPLSRECLYLLAARSALSLP